MVGKTGNDFSRADNYGLLHCLFTLCFHSITSFASKVYNRVDFF